MLYNNLIRIGLALVQLNDVDGVEGKHNVFVVVIKRVAHNSQTAMACSCLSNRCTPALYFKIKQKKVELTESVYMI
jgi:mRNA-degrading endonuclease toxin of MazEF toxin-antitoxin module